MYKVITQVFIFVSAILFIACSNNKKTTPTATVQLDKNDTTVFVEKVDTNVLIEKGFFAGLIGNDSVFIQSEPSEFEEWRDNVVIYLGNHVLYKDMNEEWFSINQSDIKVIPLEHENIAYILLTMFDAPYEDKWLVLQIYNKQVKETYTVINGLLEDIDNDGFFEIGGGELTDCPCVVALPCDSSYYSPYKIFKLNETFEFDSTLSKKLTFELYGTFLGFNYVDTVLYVPRK